jgi:hypothetical protein
MRKCAQDDRFGDGSVTRVLAFWLLHDLKPPAPTRTQARAALLPEVRNRGCRPVNLRRLLSDHLPALRDTVGIAGRAGNRVTHGDARCSSGERIR